MSSVKELYARADEARALMRAHMRKHKPSPRSNLQEAVLAIEVLTFRLLAAEKRIAELEAEKNTTDA